MLFQNRRRIFFGDFHARQIGNKQILKYLTLWKFMILSAKTFNPFSIIRNKFFFVKILPKNPYIQSQGRPCLSLIKKFFVSRYLLWQYFCHNHWVKQWIFPLVNFAVWWILRNLDPCLCFTMCRSNTHALWIRATCLPSLSDVIVRHVASVKTCPVKSFSDRFSHELS